MERSETIAVEAERWSGVGREQSCHHLKHDCILYSRAAWRGRSDGEVQGRAAEVIDLEFGSASDECLDR